MFVFEGSAVADEKRDAPRPFDVRTVEYLLRLMTDHDLKAIYEYLSSIPHAEPGNCNGPGEG